MGRGNGGGEIEGDFLPSKKMDGLAASSAAAAFALAAQWRVIRSERGERLRSEPENWQAVGKCAQDPKSLPLALEAIEDLVICGACGFVPDSLPSWPPDSGIWNPVPSPRGKGHTPWLNSGDCPRRRSQPGPQLRSPPDSLLH